MAGVLVIEIAGLSSGCGLEKHKAIVCSQGRQRHKMPYVHPLEYSQLSIEKEG
jgi:hypothetical protein